MTMKRPQCASREFRAGVGKVRVSGMLSKDMNAKLNAQITHEFYSSYLYIQMAAWFGESSLSVLEAYFVNHADEERMHATKLIDYVLKAGGHLKLGVVEAPPDHYESPLDIMTRTLKHEQGVTQKIHELVTQAEADKDYSTRSYLQWYIDEQVEEEATFGELAAITRMAGEHWLMLEDRVEKIVAQKAAAAAAAGA
jgi:ferritin